MSDIENTITENTPTNGAITKAVAEETKTVYDGAALRGRPEDKTSEVKEEKRPGYDPVDLATATPEQVKERVNYLYRQVKDGSKTINQYRQIAEQQSKQIEQLTQGFNGVVNHLTTKSLDDNEETLTELMNTAFEKGDNKGYLTAQKKLIDLGVEKRLNVERQKQQPVKPQAPPRQNYDATRLANDAVAEGNLSRDEASYTEAWQNERGEDGKILRPWAATPDVNNPTPEFAAALEETKAVFKNPRFESLSYEDKLAEVDRRMGVAKRVANQSVSAGQLTGRTKTAKVTLSADIEKMVRITKWGGSKYKTDDERLDAYRKQLANVKTNQKGTR